MSDTTKKVAVDFMNSVKTFDCLDSTIVHDRVLLVEEKKFYVQSGLLTIWSDYFHTLFNLEFQEKDEAEIELKDISDDDFEVFLKIIYPGEFVIQVSQILSLVELSYRFLSPNVLDICKKYIEKEFDQIDKLDLIKVAITHDMRTLEEKTLNYIMKNTVSFDLVHLLKLAFKYNLEKLKTHLRCFIYAAESETKSYRCISCLGGIQNARCTHHNFSHSDITRNSLIAKHIDEIAELSEEIKTFVLRSMISQ